MTWVLFWLTIGGLIGYTIGAGNKRKYETWDTNNIGEQIVIWELKKHFGKPDNYLLNNVTLAINATGTTQIDHILINRHGIFVIETKHYGGLILGKEMDKKWTQCFGNGKNYPFMNPILQNNGHINQLKRYLPLPNEAFKSIIVFTGEAKLKSDKIRNIVQKDELVKYIKQFKEVILSDLDITKAIGRLEFDRKEPCEETDAAHIEYVQSIKRQNFPHSDHFT